MGIENTTTEARDSLRSWWGLVGCLALVGLIGCKGMFGPQGIPADPVFANGKPAEAKAISGPPVAPPFSEPVPPVNRHQLDPFQVTHRP